MTFTAWHLINLVLIPMSYMAADIYEEWSFWWSFNLFCSAANFAVLLRIFLS